MSASPLFAYVDRFADRRVLVVGDAMLDHFIFGRVDRISPEAPVPVVAYVRDEYRLGGAANVAHNVAALGGRARLVSLVGHDDAAAELRERLKTAGVRELELVVDRDRPTTKKVRIVTQRNQQVARVDYESDSETRGESAHELEQRAIAAVRDSDVVVVSDYRKGVVTASLIAALTGEARACNVPVLIDPKVPQSDRYRGATLVTPNHHEAEVMTGSSIRTPDDARRAARELHERTGASVLITWGEHGMWLLGRANGRNDEALLPAATREVADVTGAGDTVIAVLALAMAAGAPLIEAATLANTAAGLVVARFGPAAISADELKNALT